MDYAQTLRSHGLRATAARLAILTAIDTTPHMDADAVHRTVQAKLGTISGQAVYDALNGLTKAGILRRIEPRGVRATYEFNHGDNHHHVVCRNCGAMEDMPCMVGHAPCITPHDMGGWDIDEAEVFYWGICPTCRTQLAST